MLLLTVCLNVCVDFFSRKLLFYLYTIHSEIIYVNNAFLVVLLETSKILTYIKYIQYLFYT